MAETVLSLAVAGVFGLSAALKTADRAALQRYLASLLPARLARVAVPWVIGLELLLVLLLVTRWLWWFTLPPLAFVAAATLVLGAGYGRFEAEPCACFGSVSAKRAPRSTLRTLMRPTLYTLRNTTIAAALLVIVQLRDDPRATVSPTTASLAVLAIPLLMALALAWATYRLRSTMPARVTTRERAFLPDLAPLVALDWYTERRSRICPLTAADFQRAPVPGMPG